jgi:hypothetical protein
VTATALALIGLFNVAGSYRFGWLGQRWPKHLLLGVVAGLAPMRMNVRPAPRVASAQRARA